jgi:hypothetical protein
MGQNRVLVGYRFSYIVELPVSNAKPLGLVAGLADLAGPVVCSCFAVKGDLYLCQNKKNKNAKPGLTTPE